jgi:hypothetical protein
MGGGAPVGAYAARPTQGTNGFAIASLVLGIFWGYGILSILAIIFGAIALKQIPVRYQGGRGLAIAGLILGILGVIGAIIVIIATVLVANNVTTSSGY